MSKEITVQDALSRLAGIAGNREICISDAAARLKSWGLDDEEKISKVTNYLTANGFIDHQRYARAYVNDKFRYNNWGRIKISVQLRYKGIEGQIISDALGVIDEEEYREKVMKITSSFIKSSKTKSRFELKSKLVRHLNSKGFESDYAFKAFSEYFSSEE